jgi:hypothetical protein
MPTEQKKLNLKNSLRFQMVKAILYSYRVRTTVISQMNS